MYDYSEYTQMVDISILESLISISEEEKIAKIKRDIASKLIDDEYRKESSAVRKKLKEEKFQSEKEYFYEISVKIIAKWDRYYQFMDGFCRLQVDGISIGAHNEYGEYSPIEISYEHILDYIKNNEELS